jgi:hypothetical protein
VPTVIGSHETNGVLQPRGRSIKRSASSTAFRLQTSGRHSSRRTLKRMDGHFLSIPEASSK